MKLVALCLALLAAPTFAGDGYEIQVDRRDGRWWCSLEAQRANLRDVLRSLSLKLGVHVEGLDVVAPEQEVTAQLDDRELHEVLARVLGAVGLEAELRTNVLRVAAVDFDHASADELRDLAVATYLTAQRRWPDHPSAVDAKLAQAAIEETRGNVPAAIAHLEAAIQRHRNSDKLPDALMHSAELLATQHEWASVVARLSELLRLDRRHGFEIPARLLLARAYAMLDDHEHAFFMLDVVDTYQPASEPSEIQRRQLIRARAELAAGDTTAAAATLDYVERLGQRDEFVLELLELHARVVERSASPAEASEAWLRYGRAAQGTDRTLAFTQAARLALEAGDELGAMFISRLADAERTDETALEIRQRAAKELGIEELLRPSDEHTEKIDRARRLIAGGAARDALGVLKPLFDARKDLEEQPLLELLELYARALAEAKSVDSAIDALRTVVPELHSADARRAVYVLAGELYEAHDRLDDAVEAYQGRL